MTPVPRPDRSSATSPPFDLADPRFAHVQAAIRRHHRRPDALIEILHAAQEVFGYLPDTCLAYVARALSLPPSRVVGVATFYNLFTHRPPRPHTCTVCVGTACYVKGVDAILRAIRDRYGVAGAEATPTDRRISFDLARCVGTCGIAPVVIVDGDMLGHVTPESALADLAARVRT